MIIKKLELHGFKSFSDRTRLLFHPGITAIIGPNGTGKSNVVDALLWTLRGRRLRSQRGDRAGENIFNGNAKQPPQSMADVAIVLGEEKESDKEDLIINHRLFRSGENEYRLNGKVTRLKDIQEALHESAIGDTDYFVIEQGSVGLFVTSKPQEKRLLLEEAAGTAFYKDKKRQAQNKLDSSGQNLLRLEDIILEVEKATISLKRQAQSAIRYRKLREHIRELTLTVYRQKIEGLETNQREVSSGYRERLDTENTIIRRIKDEEKALAEQRKEVWDFEKRLQEDKDSLYTLRSQLSRTEAEKEREEKRGDYYVEKKASAETDLAELKKEREGLEKERQEVRDNLDDLNARLKKKARALESEEKSQEDVQDDLGGREKQLGGFREEYLRRISSQTEIKNEAARFEKELELTTIQGEKLKGELESQKKGREDRASQLENRESGLAKTVKQAAAATASLESLEKQRAADRLELGELENRRNTLQKELDKKSHHLHALEKLKEQEARSADLPDLPEALGQLADLIDASEEHTALIDVLYKEEARAALVKAGDLRRILKGEDRSLKGQFLLLHQKGDEDSLPASLLNDPRVLGRLKSHLRPRSAIENQISALGDAAIVGSVQDAIDLWIQHPHFSYITLGGDLLLSSGLLKLGEKKDGLISLNRDIKGLREETTHLQTELLPLGAKIQDATQDLDALEQKAREEAAALASLEQRRGVEQKEVSFARTALEQTEAHIAVLENESRKLTEDKRDVTRNWKSLTTQIVGLKEQETGLDQKIRAEEQALAARREAAEQSRRSFFQIRAETELYQEKIDNARDLLKRLDQRHAFVENKSADLSREIDSALLDSEKLKDRLHELDTQAGRLDRESKDKASSLASREAKLSGLQSNQEATEQRIRELREDIESAKEDRVKWEVSKAERERDLVNLEESCWQELKKTLQEIKAEVPLEEGVDIVEAEASLEESKDKLQRFKAVNLMAEEEYLNQQKRLDFLTKQKADLAESIATTKEAIKKIDHESKTQFLRALIAVNHNFQDVFAQLFQGGTAQVKLTDEDDPLESGVEIVAQPPGKRVQNLNLLSGGEKTLTSLAFFFALFRYKPSPFCILDEVDAALDETNLIRFLNLMRNIKDQTQFIIITHNYKTMEVADYIYGTTMAEPNITSIYSVKIKDKDKSRDTQLDLDEKTE